VNEQVKSERMKADLITNVSHDLKTPLTSIINYVDLLKREKIENPRAAEYLEVLDQKANRLKTLTEDLVEASKASSGNVSIELTELDYAAMVQQALGEFEEKMKAAKLDVILNVPGRPVLILADGRRLWRVLENLMNNCCKYALRGSRVYVDVREEEDSASCTIKNISEAPLNISAEELTERYHVLDYLTTMEQAYACADGVLCRSGAGTVAEITALGLPALYVPLPIGNGEQRLNAADVLASGGGRMVLDADLKPSDILDFAMLISDPERQAAMARAAASTASGLTSMHSPSTRASPMTSWCRCAVETSTVPFAPGDTTMVLSPAESTVMMAVPVATSSR